MEIILVKGCFRQTSTPGFDRHRAANGAGLYQAGAALARGSREYSMPHMSEGTHSYYDWQLSTLMLAYDAVNPLQRNDLAGLEQREASVREELNQLAEAVLPAAYRANPEREFPASVVVLLTRATIHRAGEILGGGSEDGAS